MKRFVDAVALAEVRQSYRTAQRIYKDLTSLALKALSQAGDAHGEIENIYVSAMDFNSLGAYCKKFCEKIE